MKVLNVHERELPGGPVTAGSLLDSLASGREDRLWPWERWAPMRFDRSLEVGAVGGHGPIRYQVEEYTPGTKVRFRFTAPRGFVGFHEFRVLDLVDRIILQHVLDMTAAGSAKITWPLVFRPLHDALIEDSLDKAEAATRGSLETWHRWSLWARALRWFFATVVRAGPS